MMLEPNERLLLAGISGTSRLSTRLRRRYDLFAGSEYASGCDSALVCFGEQ